MTTASTPGRAGTDPVTLQSTVLERPTGGSEIVVHDSSGDLAMTAYIAVDSEDVVGLSAMR